MRSGKGSLRGGRARKLVAGNRRGRGSIWIYDFWDGLKERGTKSGRIFVILVILTGRTVMIFWHF